MGFAAFQQYAGDAAASHHGGIFAQTGHDHDVDDGETQNEESGLTVKGGTLGSAADHSHVTAGVPPAGVSLPHVGSRSWQTMSAQFVDIKSDFRLDRPPKNDLFA